MPGSSDYFDIGKVFAERALKEVQAENATDFKNIFEAIKGGYGANETNLNSLETGELIVCCGFSVTDRVIALKARPNRNYLDYSDYGIEEQIG